ncbi:YqaA family protein [Abyssibacter profundi]|uniref:VTT domain-containing protein n=1 Tax=Abyssibacter profundi TaxID=2182787 RepID=A0A363UPI2_9GAMM|nr:YqaA family protein [Abyssibacter profundi]MBV62682.1 hypothetical protein [Nevskiales bacterium]PWN57386.1 hypothetical protein DEH80_02515 [Abyssibacter profundi]
MFRRLYDWTMIKARHRHARGWLFGTAVAEAIFFPIPVDVLLAPMVMAERAQWWRLALLTTLGSVVGALIGYPLGYFLIEGLTPLLQDIGYWDAYLHAQDWFARYGFWALVVAGFTPIPFKVFTIAAGAAAMPILPFIAACAVGRFGRFGLVAGVVAAAGPTFEQRLLRYIDGIGWACLVLIGIGLLYWRLA